MTHLHGLARRLCVAALLVVASTPVSARAQSPEWTAVLAVRPNPSPYLADWESDPTIVTFVLSYAGSSSIAFHLQGSIRRGGAPVVSGRSTPFEFVRPSQLLLTTRDGVWETGTVQYESALRSQLERTGRLPEGEYEFCVDVRQGLAESPGALLATECAPFTIVVPQPPSIILPQAGDTVVAEYPTFVWTPVLAPLGERVSYHVRVAEVLPGQSPLEALNNIPQLEGDFSTTSFLYPPDALVLRDSARYAWQVQALDAAGQPLGENQGKSEVGWLVYRPMTGSQVAARPLASADSGERVLSRFTWSGIEVRVLSVRDSTRMNFSGVGRATVVPGVWEPRFRFAGLRMSEDRRRVAYAPRHSIRLPDIAGVWDWRNVLPLPVMMQVEKLVITADSATGEHSVGVTGSGVVLTSFAPLPTTAPITAADSAKADSVAREEARADSIDRVNYAAGVEASESCQAWRAGDSLSVDDWGDTTRLDESVCVVAEPEDEPATDAEGRAMPQPKRDLAGAFREYQRRHLYFRFVNLRVGSRGPGGRLVLARDWQSGDWGMPGWRMKLFRDSTSLSVADGVGTLDLKGDFTIPPSTGLVNDAAANSADSAAAKNAGTDKKFTQSASDSAITVSIRQARIGTAGEVYIHAGGIERARIGATGLLLRTGDVIVDLSSSLSPTGHGAGWQGVFIDSARVILPRTWHTMNVDPATRADSARAQIVGYRLTADATGFSGVIAGSRLDKLGPVEFAGFGGGLDSARFEFTSGTLDSGYVRGRLLVPFIEGAMPYWVNFTPAGIGSAYAAISETQRVNMPALGATALIQRGEFTYQESVGTFVFDARLDLNREGVRLERAQVNGLKILSTGELKLDRGWITFAEPGAADFKNFPVALDSIGFGSGTTGNQVWLGVAGRFQLNENLPAAAGAFRLFAKRDAVGSPWRFERVAVDKLDMTFRNAAVEFRGMLEYVTGDPIYGDAFKAAVRLSVKEQFNVDGNFIVGATRADTTASTTSTGSPTGDGGEATPQAAAASFRYWYVNARLMLPPPGIQLGTLPLSLYGFGGGAFSRMRARVDTTTLVATYVPDASVGFGLKALVSLGTTANQGFVWNADVTLEATMAPSGGLQSLTMRGDNWMITEVSRREKKIWGTVVVDLPVSRPELHANLVLNVDLKPAMEGRGWAELHFDPSVWYVNVGTPSRPDSLTLLPGSLNLKNTAFFMMDGQGVDAGFNTFLQKTKTSGKFYGRVAAGFEANARMRYRPFLVAGDGELWGEIVAKVKGYTLLEGTARATMAFRMPNPMGIEGRIRVRYKLLQGTLRGRYSMRYSWGAGADETSDTSQFVMVATTSPLHLDSAAAPNGVTYYLGMNEGTEYGTEDGALWRLRLAATPSITRRVITSPARGCTGRACAPITSWVSIGTVVRTWDEERTALTLRAPGYAALLAGTRYRATAQFVLEKYIASQWTQMNSVTKVVEFATAPTPVTLAQLLESVDPPGTASPMYYGGPNRGAVRVRFTNVHADLTNRAVVGVVTAGPDSVAGAWATGGSYPFALRNQGTGDPTRYAFTPAAGALAPSASYRFALVGADTARREVIGVSFRTSAYASLSEHVNASTRTVTPNRGAGPVSGSGNYLLGVTVMLGGPEVITWNDIDSIDVVGVSSGWEVEPRTRCHWVGGTPANPAVAAIGLTVQQLCGGSPVYENLLRITFSAPADASLPAANLASITVRLNHRREGWQTFTFTIPQLSVMAVAPGAMSTTPTTSTPSIVTAPKVDITTVPVGRRP